MIEVEVCTKIEATLQIMQKITGSIEALEGNITPFNHFPPFLTRSVIGLAKSQQRIEMIGRVVKEMGVAGFFPQSSNFNHCRQRQG